MTRLTVEGRVAAARELLQGVSETEYATLPAESKAELQEAMEYLMDAEQRMNGVSEE